jgi:hypothetical protein
MNLKDAMSEVIMRAVLAEPKKYPKALYYEAKNCESILGEWVGTERAWPCTHDRWITAIEQYLPEASE